MAKRRLLATLLALGVTTAARADVPLACAQLAIRESPGRAPRVALTCRDVAVPFPTPGGADDPSIHGLSVAVAIDDGGGTLIDVPGGAGWTVHATAPRAYVYKNRNAPLDSAVQKLVIREGRVLKLAIRGAAVGAASPAGGASVRLALGSGTVVYARFDASELVVD
jgi:hypothetical protein